MNVFIVSFSVLFSTFVNETEGLIHHIMTYEGEHWFFLFLSPGVIKSTLE